MLYRGIRENIWTAKGSPQCLQSKSHEPWACRVADFLRKKNMKVYNSEEKDNKHNSYKNHAISKRLNTTS